MIALPRVYRTRLKRVHGRGAAGLREGFYKSAMLLSSSRIFIQKKVTESNLRGANTQKFFWGSFFKPDGALKKGGQVLSHSTKASHPVAGLCLREKRYGESTSRKLTEKGL